MFRRAFLEISSGNISQVKQKPNSTTSPIRDACLPVYLPKAWQAGLVQVHNNFNLSFAPLEQGATSFPSRVAADPIKQEQHLSQHKTYLCSKI
jgi:hypothetical protein